MNCEKMHPSNLSGFSKLEPHLILKYVEEWGQRPNGRILQLNSYENRVFQVDMEQGPPLIAKFYRSGRWSEGALHEEHRFLQELNTAGVPVAAPLEGPQGTLSQKGSYWMTLFPHLTGQMPQELEKEHLQKLGEILGTIHSVGLQKKFKFRSSLDLEKGSQWQDLELLEEWVAPEMKRRYFEVAEFLFENYESTLKENEFCRIHGDFHRGNILLHKNDFSILDFDDCKSGPPVQDFWMLMVHLDSRDIEYQDKNLFSGKQPLRPQNNEEEWENLVHGYEKILPFPDHQISWVPLLRAQRIITYGAWIAKRWNDESFRHLFPDFGSYRYWAEETEALEKIARTL